MRSVGGFRIRCRQGRFRPFLFPVTASAPSCGRWWELHPGLGGDFPIPGEAGKAVPILTAPLGRHSSPARGERGAVIPTRAPCFRTNDGDGTASRHGFLQGDVRRGQARPCRAAQSGNGHLGTRPSPARSSCLPAPTETVNSPAGTPRATVAPAVRDSGWLKHQTAPAWIFQSRAWRRKRVRASEPSHPGVSNSLRPLDCSPPQAPLSMGFPRQEYCSGLSFPCPGDLPDPEIEPMPLRLLR